MRANGAATWPKAAAFSSVDNARHIGEFRAARPPPATRDASTGTTGMSLLSASRALERFTVLDLTRVRAGPTCVRQLGDWGANVIKIETPPHVEGGEPPGGPRADSDFQNL